MFCPKCSHQQANEAVRFCSRCGFQLDLVKELLASEGAAGPSGSLKDEKGTGPRQTDILIGASIMLVGAIKAALLTSNIRAPGEEEIIYGLYFLCFGFALFLLFAQLTNRQRGLTLGATLMFAGALAALAATQLFGGMSVILIAAILFPIIFFWVRLSRLFMKTFFDKDVLEERAAPQLPEPASAITNTRLKTSDLAQAPNVTEETTALFEK